MTEKSTDDDNDGCNGNYDGNFDNNYDKKSGFFQYEALYLELINL